MARGRAEPRARARSDETVVLGAFPERHEGRGVELARFAPSGRSLLVAFGLLAGVLLSWLVARESSLFAVRAIQVEQATPSVATQVRRALRTELGRSLLKVDIAEATRALEQLPTVQSASLDRAFPTELRVVVVPERAVALVRQGKASAVVSARGRVMRRVADRATRPDLPRIWVPRTVDLTPGRVADGELAVAVRAVTPLASGGFPGRVGSVRATSGELTLRLRSGLEVRLGDAADASLKLAIAARVIPLLDTGTTILDVSVPERPVASMTLDSQVEVEPSASTIP